eukprot:XP_001704332.1 Xaa-Pro dipeptidase [Giardia lamblia ATCC 50803]
MLVKVMFGATHDPNILYLTRTQLDDNVLVIKLEDNRVLLIVSENDFSRACIRCSHAHVMQHLDFEERCSSVSQIIYTIYKRYGGTSILMPFTFPVGLFVKLKELSPSIPMTIVKNQAFLIERLRKTPMELQYIKDAVRAATVAFSLIEDVLRRSVIELDPAAGCIPKTADKPGSVAFPIFTDTNSTRSKRLSEYPQSSHEAQFIQNDKVPTSQYSGISGMEPEGLETYVSIDNCKYILKDTKTNETVTATYLKNMVRTEMARLGYFLESCIIACGRQACDPSCHGYGVLRPNELIVCDIYPRCIESGYYGDMTRTFLKGTPSPDQQKLMQTVLHAQSMAIHEIIPGKPYRDLNKVVNDLFLSMNYTTKKVGSHWQGFCHGLGHGVGLEIHEPPFIDGEETSDVCTVGTVFTIEPGLYYPSIGGCRVEDVVVVTEDGAEVLGSYSYNWIIP